MSTTGFDGIDVVGDDISYDPDPAAHGTISLTVQQFEDFTKEHKITWSEVPTGVEPELQPKRLNIGSLLVELAEVL